MSCICYTAALADSSAFLTAAYPVPNLLWFDKNVPLSHLQDAYKTCLEHNYMCPRHNYICPRHNCICVFDTFYKRVFDTFKNVFIPFIYGKRTKILTHFKFLPNFQTIVQRKYVRILAITFAVGIEPRTSRPILYYYTTWPQKLYL